MPDTGRPPGGTRSVTAFNAAHALHTEDRVREGPPAIGRNAWISGGGCYHRQLHGESLHDAGCEKQPPGQTLETAARSFAGMALVPGIPYGEAFIVKQSRPITDERMTAAADIEYEIQKFRAAVATLGTQLLVITNKVLQEVGAETSQLFDGETSMPGDAKAVNEIEPHIRQQALPLDVAIDQLLEKYQGRFASIRDADLRDTFDD